MRNLLLILALLVLAGCGGQWFVPPGASRAATSPDDKAAEVGELVHRGVPNVGDLDSMEPMPKPPAARP